MHYITVSLMTKKMTWGKIFLTHSFWKIRNQECSCLSSFKCFHNALLGSCSVSSKYQTRLNRIAGTLSFKNKKNKQKNHPYGSVICPFMQFIFRLDNVCLVYLHSLFQSKQSTCSHSLYPWLYFTCTFSILRSLVVHLSFIPKKFKKNLYWLTATNQMWMMSCG